VRDLLAFIWRAQGNSRELRGSSQRIPSPCTARPAALASRPRNPDDEPAGADEVGRPPGSGRRDRNDIGGVPSNPVNIPTGKGALTPCRSI
jgi:hypothetical protein